MKYYVTEIMIQVNGFEKHYKTLVKAESSEDALKQACEGQLHNDLEDGGSEWEDGYLIDGCWEFVYTPCDAREVKDEHVEILKQYL